MMEDSCKIYKNSLSPRVAVTLTVFHGVDAGRSFMVTDRSNLTLAMKSHRPLRVVIKLGKILYEDYTT